MTTLVPEKRRRPVHRTLCKLIGAPPLTAKDKLSLEGVGIILAIISAVAGAFAWSTNTFSEEKDLKNLRCDMYMLHLTTLETKADPQPETQRIIKRIERRWNQMCSGKRFVVGANKA